MGSVLRHARLAHGIPASALLANIPAICQVGWVHAHVRHIVGGHMRVLRHALLTSTLGRHMLLGGLFRRLNLVAIIDTILAALAGFRCVQAGLER